MQEMFDQDTSDRDYYDKYLLKDSSDWNLSKARKQLRTDKEWKSKMSGVFDPKPSLVLMDTRQGNGGTGDNRLSPSFACGMLR